MSKAPDTITPDTRIPLKLAYGLLLIGITGTTAVVGAYNELRQIKNAVKHLADNAWTVPDQTVYSSDLARLNPQLKVPPVRKIGAGANEQ